MVQDFVRGGTSCHFRRSPARVVYIPRFLQILLAFWNVQLYSCIFVTCPMDNKRHRCVCRGDSTCAYCLSRETFTLSYLVLEYAAAFRIGNCWSLSVIEPISRSLWLGWRCLPRIRFFFHKIANSSMVSLNSSPMYTGAFPSLCPGNKLLEIENS